MAPPPGPRCARPEDKLHDRATQPRRGRGAKRLFRAAPCDTIVQTLGRTTNMKRIIFTALAISAGALIVGSSTQSAETGFQTKPYFQLPLEKDPSRVVRMH